MKQHKTNGKVRHIRWSPELNRMVLVDRDGNDIDVAFGKGDPPFIPNYQWGQREV